MEDDDVQDASILRHTETIPATTTAAAATTETPASDAPTTEQGPPKPPRPLTAQQEAEKTLKEAFPTIDAPVIKAVLIASGGRVEPAFNALLAMTDPDAAAEIPEPAPPQPPRPQRHPGQPMSQIEADELFARQLAEHYDASQRRGDGRQGAPRQPPRPGQQRQEEEEFSFFDDELPVIKENLRKGFLETQTKVNSWITNLKKRIDGDDISEIRAQQEREHARQGYPPQGQYARRSGDATRRSGDSGRYDADAQGLDEDFAGIQLHDESSSKLHHVVNPRSSSLADTSALTPDTRRSTRPLANPDLFKPTPATPKEGRKVSFQEHEDLYNAPDRNRASQQGTPASGAKASKWQPLSSVEPQAVGETDNDPFSLGDSEDENPSKDRVGNAELRKEDTERLKEAASKAQPVEPAVKPEPAETEGTVDKEAKDRLT
jgi:CDK inhibitor PHO81